MPGRPGSEDMAINFDSTTIQPVATPAAAAVPRQPIVTPIGEREGASNERRESARNTRERVSTAFRSFLNAATLAGITETLGAERSDVAVDDVAPVRETRVPDRRKDPTVLEADEAEGLYRTAQAADEGPRSSRAREFHAAATRYAKSFFAVEGTFARPGESLELTA